MCLPAAYSTVDTWIQGFGLEPMPDEDLDAACKDLRLLIFPGTQVLQKQLLTPLPIKQGPLMTPPWAEEPAGPLTDGQTAVDTSSEPQQALDAEAVTPPLPVLEAQAAATAVAAPSDVFMPVQAQPEAASMLPSVAAAGAADDTPMVGHLSGAWSDPEATVEIGRDAVMAEPAHSPAEDQAVSQDALHGLPAAATTATTQLPPSCAEESDWVADTYLELGPAEATPEQYGVSSQVQLHGQELIPTHLEQEAGPSVREDDATGRAEEACAATQDSFVQVHCTDLAMRQSTNLQSAYCLRVVTPSETLTDGQCAEDLNLQAAYPRQRQAFTTHHALRRCVISCALPWL